MFLTNKTYLLDRNSTLQTPHSKLIKEQTYFSNKTFLQNRNSKLKLCCILTLLL